MNCMFLLYSIQVQDWTARYLQHNGITNSETEMCMSICFVMSNWKVFSMKMRRLPH